MGDFMPEWPWSDSAEPPPGAEPALTGRKNSRPGPRGRYPVMWAAAGLVLIGGSAAIVAMHESGSPAPLAAGLLRSGRVQRPALGSGRGRRSGRQRAPAVPVARGPVADGPGAHAAAHAAAGSGETGAVARPPAGARRDAASRTRLRADALAGAAAGADLAVAFPVGAAATTMALGRRGLVAPLRLVAGPVRLVAGPVTLVAGPALSPATRVVMKDIGTTTARKPETGPKPRWLCWSEIISDAAVKEETWRASSC